MIGVVASQIVTPTGCAITLTNAGLGVFGLAPMTVIGQTVSATGDDSTNFGMTSGLAGKPVAWIGIRAVECDFDDMPSSPAIPVFQIARASDFENVVVKWDTGLNKWLVSHADFAGAYIGLVDIAGAVTDVFAIGVDGATGDATIYSNGVLVADKTTPASYGNLSGLGGLFSGQSASIVVQARNMGVADTAQITLRTSGISYTNTYPAGVFDWCGNAI